MPVSSIKCALVPFGLIDIEILKTVAAGHFGNLQGGIPIRIKWQRPRDTAVMGNKYSNYDSDDAVEDIVRTTKSEVKELGPSRNDFEETLRNYESPSNDEDTNVKDDAISVSPVRPYIHVALRCACTVPARNVAY